VISCDLSAKVPTKTNQEMNVSTR